MNSIRNKGVGLSLIKPSFQVENTNLDFKWKVRLSDIPRLHPNLNFCSTAKK